MLETQFPLDNIPTSIKLCKREIYIQSTYGVHTSHLLRLLDAQHVAGLRHSNLQLRESECGVQIECTLTRRFLTHFRFARSRPHLH